MIKICSVNTGSSVRWELHIDFRLMLEEALSKVNAAIAKLAELIRKVGQAGCDVIVLPEDCLCTSAWENGNPEQKNSFLTTAVDHVLDRLGAAAAESGTYLICCNDRVDREGKIRNTAFFLGRDGGRLGHYDKVILPVQESTKTPGNSFPVFETPDLGRIGILICYDIVFPETARCLALEGTDIIFNPTVGGAALGGGQNKASPPSRLARSKTSLRLSCPGEGGDLTPEASSFLQKVISWPKPWGVRKLRSQTSIQSVVVTTPTGRMLRRTCEAGFSAREDPRPLQT